jgi:hypothetical protein
VVKVLNHNRETFMTRILSMAALSAVAALFGIALGASSAPAQTASSGQPCGPVAYSAAEQKYVGVPCTAPTPQAEAGKAAPCGPVAYSAAEQKYVGVPCTAPTPQAEAGKPAPCGIVSYSVAEQRNVGIPCPQK